MHEGSYIKPGSDPIHDVEYWKKGLRHSVYFTHGIRNAVDSGHTTFLELAPNPVALMQVGLTTADAGLHDAQLIPTLARKQDEVESITSTLAQLYVYGHALDPRTLFSPARGPWEYANIPPTRFKRKEHWLDVHFSGDGSILPPGSHVALPDGRHVWEYAPRTTTDLADLVKLAAAQVMPDAQLAAAEQRAVPAYGARLVTTLARHPGGASVQVHARVDESFTLVYDALVSRGGVASVLPTAVGAGTAIAAGTAVATVSATPVGDAPVGDPRVAAISGGEDPESETLGDSLTTRYMPAGFTKWAPDSGETIGQRLGAIVGAAMGYEVEDLPWEVPLIELGLDSLMAVRIKNRVEYDFDLPPIQLTAVRDANLYAVEKLIEYAIEHRDEVQELAEHQKTETADEIAKEQAALLYGGAKTDAEAPSATEAEAPAAPPAGDLSIPPPPTDPSGPTSNGGQGGSEGSRRGAQPGGGRQGAEFRCAAAGCRRAGRVRHLGDRHGEVPGRHLQPAAQAGRRHRRQDGARLAERAEGPISAEDVLTSETIEALAEKVRAYFEAGQIDGFVRTLRAPENDLAGAGVRVPSGRRVHGGVRAAAQAAAAGTPRCTAWNASRALSRSGRAQYVPKLLEMNDGKTVRPGRVVAWRCAGAMRARSSCSGRARTFAGSG